MSVYNNVLTLIDIINKFVICLATKTNTLDDNEISDILGMSAIIINDLKQRRKKDYNFSWDSALQVGLFLQRLA